MLDGLVNAPGELFQVTGLAALAVHVERDGTAQQFTRLAHGGDGAARRGLLKSLANAPGPALLFHLALDVTTRHVQAHRVTPDVAGGVGRFDVAAAFANGHHQFNLVMEIGRQAGVVDDSCRAIRDSHHGICWLHEKEGRLATREAHLLRVFSVVATHTVNTMNGKFTPTHNGHSGDGVGRQNIAHVECFLGRQNEADGNTAVHR